MTVTIDRAALGRHMPSLPARVSLTPAPGGLDGMWWPRSRVLTCELPALTAALGDLWGRITGVMVNPAHWSAVPRRVSVAGRTVHVGWSAMEQDPHRLTLFCVDGRWDVLVIPPETGPDAAARLMAGGGVDAPGQEESADRIDVRRGEEAWETEGGAGPPLSAPRPVGSPGAVGRRSSEVRGR
ncbi:DUF5994 family protein [Streptomyces sp. NPDC006393]|uniref:DUF5994 family protein n=1 Tax=Streptomyces sp. NPDC006393 TaxID=3156763 RepID=UPI0033C4F89D